MKISTTTAAVSLFGSRAEQLDADRAAACDTASRLAYIKLPKDEPRDADEIHRPTDVESAERYAMARISHALQDPDIDLAQLGKAMRVYKRFENQVIAIRESEKQFDTDIRHADTRLQADRIRAAAQAKAEAEAEAAATRERDRVWMDADSFAVKYGS